MAGSKSAMLAFTEYDTSRTIMLGAGDNDFTFFELSRLDREEPSPGTGSIKTVAVHVHPQNISSATSLQFAVAGPCWTHSENNFVSLFAPSPVGRFVDTNAYFKIGPLSSMKVPIPYTKAGHTVRIKLYTKLDSVLATVTATIRHYGTAPPYEYDAKSTVEVLPRYTHQELAIIDQQQAAAAEKPSEDVVDEAVSRRRVVVIEHKGYHPMRAAIEKAFAAERAAGVCSCCGEHCDGHTPSSE